MSTFIEGLGQWLTERGHRVAVLAVSRLVGAAHAWALGVLRGLRPPGRQDAGAPSTIEVMPTLAASRLPERFETQ